MDLLELEHYAQLLQTGHRAKDQLKRMQQQQGSSWGSWREHAAQVLGDSQVLGGSLAPDGSAELPPSAAQLVRRRSTLRQALAGQQHTPATKED
ncbi:hypothetical protein OEZ85_006306 [Tetradesmus obliquus]|uniref:Uncharacterized protein n=1 Tax=Tetradesmus obliquus TaxID=3088 RepID=A0ABY8TU59_TETOB|nr:hypothetical protein OEZ85_006306 [Tetradesmus obliquus]